jgi:hypothetical protein
VAEHAVAADRFARKIIGILAVCVMRSRQLNGNPLARFKTQSRHHIQTVLYFVTKMLSEDCHDRAV